MSNKLSLKAKRDIMVALLLVVCLLLSVAVLILVEDKVGSPVYTNGQMTNIKISITEICSANRSVIATDSGEFPDYIELYNAGESFNLKGFGIANQVGTGVVYTFGDVEFPKESYLLIYIDGTNIPFRLSSAGGEYIALVANDGTVVATATTLATKGDEAMIYSDGEYVISDKPSPGYPNTNEGRKEFLDSLVDRDNDLVINEIFTDNRSSLPDYTGEFCDIIELKNISSAIISTKGYYISDSAEDRYSCPLPERELAPGDIVLVFASGKNILTESGEFHSDFRLSDGESVIVSCFSKLYYQPVKKCESNCSLSRIQTENGVEYTEMAATPGYENDSAGREDFLASRTDTSPVLVINELLLSADDVPYGGKLRDVIEICNISTTEISAKGWYISDSEDDPFKYALPDVTLSPDECLVLYAENGEGENICGFGLSSGESVYLTSPQYLRSDSVPCASAGEGMSRSRIVENGEAVYVNGEITIGFPNSDSGRASFASSVRPGEIEISEVVTSNKKYLAGAYGTYHDFAELHNRTDRDIDLTGYYLSDDPKEPRGGSLEGITIKAGGYVVVILSSDGINIPEGYAHLPFSLSSSGETLTLSLGDDIIDTAVIPSLGQNTAFGRADGSDAFAVLESPTPEKANSARAKTPAAVPTASIPQGVYNSASVTVELTGEGRVYYTLDCSEPNAGSTLYTSPIVLTSTTVIRCCSVADGKPMSDISDLTYVINEPDTLETISIVTTPENLWDYYTGIYATGPRAASSFPYDGANYYNRWEKEATVSFFDKDGGGFSENCGIRMFGGLSRALPKKSFACFFRSSYGAGELNYQLFEDEELSVYESFVLRNTGQDYSFSCMRDAMITSLAGAELGLDVQNYRPVVLYLNGEYWGLYFIREKLNENYVAGHYNVDSSKTEVAVANGKTSKSYTDLVNYAAGHDLTVQEYYDHVCSLMDVENYIDYIVAEIIIGNADNGNIRFFTYEGGKWRWMMYDVDQSFRSASYNSVSEHLNPAGTGGGDNFSTRLINALLKNPEFKDKFLREMAFQLENVWTKENGEAYIDKFESMIANDIARDRARWDRSYDSWKNAVNNMRAFVASRESYVEKYVRTYFSLSDSQMREYGFDI